MKRGITEAIIAIPSLSREELARIFEMLSSSGCHVRMIPLVEDTNDQRIRPLREVNITDILFRSEVNLDKQAIGAYIKDKRVLVTGGGGSIGSELCRQIARFGAKSITIFDIYENCAYELYCELKDSYGEALDVRVAIGSIRDKKRLQKVFEQVQPEIVFHAAAHKHVPLMEDAPAEAVKNNVFGTLNVLKPRASSAWSALCRYQRIKR
jgi:FlaA1/EpsC-like NDP-sugar epimerase